MKKNQKSARQIVASPASRRTRRQTLRSALPELLENRTLMSTYSVTTTADSGAGSLRQAIMNVDADTNPDLITFNIPGSGVQTISPTSAALPAITNTVTIDGTSQPNYAGTPLIELNGSNTTGAGLDFETGSAGSMVMGLTIDSFSGAGVVLNSGNATLSNNYIGTDPTGMFAEANNDGVDIDSNGNTVENNLISGNNNNGVLVSGDGNVLTGNLIGPDVTGAGDIGNSVDGGLASSGGVYVTNATNTTIGGTTAAARNVISGNDQGGVVLVNDTGTGNLVEGNYIGVDATGEVVMGNSDAGIDLGTTKGAPVSFVSILDNVISGSVFSGIYLNNATSNTIQGNLIGTDAAGRESWDNFGNPVFGNFNDGITIDTGSANNLIGGTVAADRNVIAGNYANGITVVGAATSPNDVQGNFIGVDATGQTVAPNLGDGILVDTGLLNVGDAVSGAGNVLSGNDGVGIDLEGGKSVVYGNLIGLAADGITALGNGGDGVRINQSSGNLIGGDAAGEGNVIAFNGALSPGRGVNVVSGVKNAIEGNSIYSNATLGIDLGNDGPTANDSQSHAGPNNYQDFPVLDTTVGNDGTTATVTGTMTGLAGATFTIDFYTDTTATADPSGYGQGQVFQGSESVTIGSGGTAPVSFSAPTPVGTVWTATATDSARNTSEFALDVTEGQPTSQPNSIGGVVSNDVTGNGFSADDFPLANFTVNLFKNGGTSPFETAVSDITGFYSFTGLGAGAYTVQEVPPAGWTETGGASGYTVTATSGVNSTGNNFDDFKNFAVSGKAFNDLTGDGITGDDTALPGITVTLSGGNLSSPVSTVTASDGTYSFSNVGPGTYTVSQSVPAGWTQTVGVGGYSVSGQSGQNVGGENFADFQNVSVSGVAYNDLTGNGFSSDDTPLAGVTVDLFKNGGTSPAATAVTASNGIYSFTNLGPGSYSVQEVVPAGSIETGGNAGYMVSATSGSAYNGDNFDNFQSFSVSGKVYNDLTGNGITSDDTALAGVTIQLLSGSTVVASTTSAADGTYSFANVGAGSYTVSEVVPSGSTQTAGNSGYNVTAQSGHTGDNFADFQNMTISGTTFQDVCGDGFSPEDPGMGGVTIDLFKNGGTTPAATTVTTSNGTYTFTNVGPGSYSVQEVVPANWIQTGGNAGYTITAKSGANSTGNNFDNFHENYNTSDISCISYVINGCTKVTTLAGNTHEGDQVQVTFIVAAGKIDTISLVSYTAPDATFNASDAYEQVVFDSATGTYTGGTHTLCITIPLCYYQIDFVCGPVMCHFGPAGSNSFYHAQNRIFDSDNSGTDAQFSGGGELSGYVYDDLNADKTDDGKDTGIAGVIVTLTGTDSSGHQVHLTRTTAANGYFYFMGLRAGTYTITETQPAGFTSDATDVGTVNGTTDGKAVNTAGGQITNIVLKFGADGVSYDFGEIKLGYY